MQRWGAPRVELHPFEGRGHRYRVRLSVRGRAGALEVGIFEEGSHRLVSIPRCPVHHPEINRLTGRLIELGNELGIEPYDEKAHRGLLRAVQMAVHPATARVQLVLLVLTRALNQKTIERRLLKLVAALSEETHSVFVASLPERTNSLVGKEWLHLHGPAFLEDSVNQARVYLPPDAFGQANPVLHERAVIQIHEFARDAPRIVEYYAGVGSIGLGLACAGQAVAFNEIGAGSLAGLRHGLKRADLEECTVLEGPAGRFAHAYGIDDTVVVDPPRKGLDIELLARLCEEPPRRLVYLSCGLPALLQESERLRSTGRYQIHHVSAWAYFPFTEHVETLVVFDRV